MKKLFSLFAAFLFVGSMWAANVSVTFSSWSTSVNTYSSTEWTDKGCTFTFANNNQKAWEYVRCGSKGGSESSSTTSGTSTIRYNSKVTVPISSVVLSTPSKITNGSSSSITITGIEVAAYSDNTFTTLVSSKDLGTLSYTSSNCPESFTITPTSAWAKDLYYKITISWTAKGTKNSGLNISSMTLTEATACNNSITISKAENPANGTFVIDNSGVVCIDEGNASTTVTATPASHYHLANVTSTVGTVGDIEGNSCTITNINANTTIAVEFAEDTKYAVNWYANGALIETQYYYEGSKITGHSAPTALSPNYEKKRFVGWVETPLAEATDEAPTMADFSNMDAAAKTFHALYATATKTADPSLTKQGSSATFSANDNIVIVATNGNDIYALYQETANSSYVNKWAFENSATTVDADAKNYVTLGAVPEKSTFYLGDGSNGYLYTSGSNNLSVSTENASEWTIEWNSTKSKFTVKPSNDKYLCMRGDLTGANKNLYRLLGNTTTDNAIAYFDIYKFVPTTYNYSAYVTTVPLKPAAPISWTVATGSAYVPVGAKVSVLPSLTNESSLAVAYGSTAEDVATVDEGTGAITPVAVGETTIKATYSATTEGNYKTTIAEYTLNVYGVKSMAISGEATVTEYAKNAAFNFAGLVATATFDDDETANVTAMASWEADPETITADCHVNVTASLGGKTSAIKVVAVTVTETGFDNIETSAKAVKVLRDGQIYILRGEKVYTIQGQLVK